MGTVCLGEVDAGETTYQAVLRETHEELGLEPSVVKPIFLHDEIYSDHSDGRLREFSLYFAVVPSSVIKRIKLAPNEVSEVQWFRRNDLEQLVDQKSDSLIVSSATQLWRSIFAHLQSITT